MLNLLFPKVCNGCQNRLLANEQIICAKCRHDLPLACHHRTDNEALKNVFYGRFPVQKATALVQFQKRGITQNIMHNLKYRGQHNISNFFGQWLGTELMTITAYRSVDFVIPVPLHKIKLRKRGYNQVSGFAKEIALALQIPCREDLLLKISKTSSQVFKQRFKRFASDEVFVLSDPKVLENKHILLVDDIVTTGATLESCAQQLLKASNVKISIATIAMA